jgi:hypothetical protein
LLIYNQLLIVNLKKYFNLTIQSNIKRNIMEATIHKTAGKLARRSVVFIGAGAAALASGVLIPQNDVGKAASRSATASRHLANGQFEQAAASVRSSSIKGTTPAVPLTNTSITGVTKKITKTLDKMIAERNGTMPSPTAVATTFAPMLNDPQLVKALSKTCPNISTQRGLVDFIKSQLNGYCGTTTYEQVDSFGSVSKYITEVKRLCPDVVKAEASSGLNIEQAVNTAVEEFCKKTNAKNKVMYIILGSFVGLLIASVVTLACIGCIS